MPNAECQMPNAEMANGKWQMPTANGDVGRVLRPAAGRLEKSSRPFFISA
jgi:hypothetical protein